MPHAVLGAWVGLLGSLLLGGAALAGEVTVPLHLDLAFVREQLISQLYVEAGERTPRWQDPGRCSEVQLAEPQLDTIEGRLRVLSRAEAAAGLPLGGRCIFSLGWKGIVEVLLEPGLDAAAQALTFRVVDSSLYDDALRKPVGARLLWGLVKRFLHPRIQTLRIDLSRPFAELRAWLPIILPASRERVERLLGSVEMREPRVLDKGVGVTVAFTVDSTAAPSVPEPPLSPQERARWESRWQAWDAFLTFVVKHVARDLAAGDGRAVLDVLLDARHVLLEVLAPAEPLVADPVPGLFLRTWERLAPLLRAGAGELPAETALRYASFITASDALAALAQMEGELGLDISADGLRRLARMMVPESPEDPVAYDVQIDPELRALLGFGPALEPPRIDRATHLDPLAWLVPAAWAGGNAETLKRLNAWAPTRRDLDEYLPLVRALLDDVRTERLGTSELEGDFHQLYRDLVFATAWQESCWRQFVRRRGKLVPLRSPVGSVGIMQVNQHVWRGIYDVTGLNGDIAYNARAGAEILFHYLRDYAIAAGEHRRQGGVDNLPRATYAIYNGGPGHRARYRTATTRASLRSIDAGFWRKFEAVRAGRELDVVECYR